MLEVSNINQHAPDSTDDAGVHGGCAALNEYPLIIASGWEFRSILERLLTGCQQDVILN